jgi:hypothetical protein
MAHFNKTSITLNIQQNQSDFELEALEKAPIIFKEKLFSKTLDPPKKDPQKLENYRTVTVKCLQHGCR